MIMMINSLLIPIVGVVSWEGGGLKPEQGSLIRLPKIIMKRKLREELDRQRLN